MAGMFELFIDARSRYRFRVVAPDGTVMAVSKGFSDKTSAVAGIRAVREYAGTGLISDLCPVTGQAVPGPHSPGTGSVPVRPVGWQLPSPLTGNPPVKPLPGQRRRRMRPVGSAW